MSDFPKTPEELAELLRLAIPINGRDVDTAKLKYVIYARKSTDEESKQVFSIEDQVDKCVEFAERNELKKVDILIEKRSAKEPDIRPIFREMLNGLKSGKYDGIIAWHPDRLSRNMKEAGEVIDLLDKHIIADLKFPSFSFTNDTSGKMLLGITFVLSKEYSDKLSDDVMRGNEKSIERGAYVNKAKNGYFKDRNSNLIPNGENFVLLQNAFQLRLEGKTFDEICDYLKDNNYYHSNTETSPKVYGMTKQRLLTIMKDPVYTGILMYGKGVVVNLIKIQGFIPMITVDEFFRINKLTGNSEFIKLSKRYKKGDNKKANLMTGMIICGDCNEALTPGITSKKLKNGSEGYFYYRCDTVECPQRNKSIRAKEIIGFATDYLEQKPFSSKGSYDHFVNEMKNVLSKNSGILKNNILVLSKQINYLKERFEQVKDLLVGNESDNIKDYYRNDIVKIEASIKDKEKEITKLKKLLDNEKDGIITYSEFIKLMEKVPENIPKMTQMSDLDYIMRKIFLNFYVKDKKPYKQTLNPPFDSLENQNVLKGARERT